MRMIDAGYVMKAINRHLKHPPVGRYEDGFNDGLNTAILEIMAALSQTNEPLTLDELRQMDGQPVYVVIEDGLEPLKMWALVDYIEEEMCLILTNNLGGRSEYYDEDNLNQDHITAYRRQPEGEEDT